MTRVLGTGSTTAALTTQAVQALLARADQEYLRGRGVDPTHQRLLVIIPDGTRSAPIPLFFRLLYAQVGQRAAQLDYLIALGTHPPLSPHAIDRLVGVTAAERAASYPNVRIFNHAWDDPSQLQTVGVIPRAEVAALTDGRLVDDVPVTLNRLLFAYDLVLICGPVFPHEVAGFSGGTKYLVPGIAGPEIINVTHWLGALVTSLQTIGRKETPVRRLMDRAAHLVRGPLLGLCLVLRDQTLQGLYIGPLTDAWSLAADLSAQVNISTVERPYRQVLAAPAARYADLWTAAKAMYKTEPVVAEGGEVILYAPQLTEVSYTHGQVLDQVGYHVKDYFLTQWERFQHIPGSILAHSTHLKGAGTYDLVQGIETPRITVTLATGIPQERCLRLNLGYADYRQIDPAAWQGREDEGLLYVPQAGERLYRLRGRAAGTL